MQQRELLIFGAGGFGREVASWAQRAQWDGLGFEVVAFVDDHAITDELNGYPVLSLAGAAATHPQAFVLATVGQPEVRQRMIAKAAELGLAPTPPLIHPNVEFDHARVSFAEGVVVCPGSTLTVDIEVQAHVQINLHCTVGHDSILGAYATLSPGVHISGNVTVGERCFLGTGAVTVNGLPGKPVVLGPDSVVGAGAVVTRDVGAGATVVGVPAKPR